MLTTTQARLEPQNGMVVSAKIKIPAHDMKNIQSRQFIYIQASSSQFILENIVRLSFEIGYIFIQTDKPIYKPGSTVKYRLFTVGHTLDPKTKPVSIEILNPDGIVVDKNSALSEDGGIITKNYDISDISVTGIWKIVARFEDNLQETFATEFEIKEYVLPNFKVTLESSQKFFYIDDNELIIDITARYLFGENVQGQAFAIFGVVVGHNKKSITESLSNIPISDGKGHAKLTRQMLQSSFPNLHNIVGNSIYVSVSVLTGSDMVQAEKSGIYIVRSPYRIVFPKASKYFKPGMPFSLALVVEYPGGSPAPNIPVCTVTTPKDCSVSQADGTAYVVVNIETNAASQLSVTVKTEVSNLPESRQTSAVWTIYAYKTPGNSRNYLHLTAATGKQRPGDTLFVSFYLGVSNPVTGNQIHYFTYIILSKGKVFQFGRLPRQAGQNPVLMSLPITSDLIPSLRIVAYYKIGNDEIIADSIWVDVEDTCMGVLKVTGASQDDNLIQRPHTHMNLKVTGNPGAKVGLVAVDKAVYVLKEKTKLSQAKIWKTVEKKDTGCTTGGGRDSADVFVGAGLAVQTSSGYRTATDCPSSRFRRRRYLDFQLVKKASKAKEYLNHVHRKCCEDGMTENPMGYSCARRSQYILDGPECIRAFLDCCHHFFGSTVKTNGTFHETSTSKGSESLLVTTLGKETLKEVNASGKYFQGMVHLTLSSIEDIRYEDDEDEDEDNDNDDDDDGEVASRSQFAESWLWMEETLPLEADFNGFSSKTLPLYLEDSITTWEVLAISLSKTKGICIADPYEIMVKQDFFIDLRLPYSIVRNEQVAIRAVVYNYAKWTFNVRVDLVYNEKLCSSSTRTDRLRQHITVQAGTSHDVTYVIVPLEVGDVEIEVKAFVKGIPLADGVRKKLRVVPEGMRILKNVRSVLLDPQNQASASGQQVVNIEPMDLSDVVPNTEPVTLISITGDIVSETIENSIDGANLKHLIQIPSGCGEQNMIGLTPAVIATHYLDSTDQWQRIGVERRAEAINIIKKGYIQQLAYRKSDSSYAAFIDRPSSTWLTAYVVKVFAMASPLISVDSQLLCGAVKWLIKQKQLFTGAFKEDAPVIHGEMVGGFRDLEPEVSLTAFVVIAMHESKKICQIHVSDLDMRISQAGEYLAGRLESLQKSYSVAITSYALSLLGRNKDALKLIGHFTGTHWPDPSSKLYSLEATSYGLLTLLQINRLDLAHPVVRWLTEQRFYGGGYGSTQATIMVFQALAQYQMSALKSRRDDDFLDITIMLPTCSDSVRWRIQHENAMLTRTQQTKSTEGFTISARGTGKGTLSVMRVYYAPLTEDMALCKKFHVTVSLTKTTVKKPEGALSSRDMEICIQFLGDTDATMTIVDISLLTGFSPDKDDLQKLTNHVDKYISRYEMNNILSNKGSLILYLDKVSNTQRECLRFKVHQYFEVGIIQPGTVTVYEYYAMENRCTKFYHPRKEDGLLSTLCQENTCRCMKEKCSSVKKITSTPSNAMRMEAARKPEVDYVYKGYLEKIEQKGTYIYYFMKIVEVIKEGAEPAVQGKIRQFISPLLCQGTLEMQVGKGYLLWSRRSDTWDLKKEMAYLLTSYSWIELWPTSQECQQGTLQVLCQELQAFSERMKTTSGQMKTTSRHMKTTSCTQ
ncbi:venom factor-like isoform 2-T2 [Liasis olivaceus]